MCHEHVIIAVKLSVFIRALHCVFKCCKLNYELAIWLLAALIYEILSCIRFLLLHNKLNLFMNRWKIEKMRTILAFVQIYVFVRIDTFIENQTSLPSKFYIHTKNFMYAFHLIYWYLFYNQTNDDMHFILYVNQIIEQIIFNFISRTNMVHIYLNIFYPLDYKMFSERKLN